MQKELYCTLYGTKQAALQFWHALMQQWNNWNMSKAKMIPVCFTDKTRRDFVSWWPLNVGEAHAVHKAKKENMKEFDCEDSSKLQEFIGSKIKNIALFVNHKTEQVLILRQEAAAPVQMESTRDQECSAWTYSRNDTSQWRSL
jgi:hypothetical protein